MALLVLPICFYGLVYKRAKEYGSRDRVMIYSVFVLYVIAMIYYCNYVNSIANIGMGIPGADMLAHFRGAEKLSEGLGWKSLAVIASRYEAVGITTIGYFLYTALLRILIFTFPILSTEANVYCVYIIQITFALNAAMRLSSAYSTLSPKNNGRLNYFLFVALCAPYMVQSSQLMRDIYYMFFLSIVIEILVKNYYVEDSAERHLLGELEKHRMRFYLVLFVLMAISILMRFYVAMIVLPIFLYYTKHEKIGMISSLTISVILIAGGSVVNLLKTVLGVPWDFGSFTIGEFLYFFLFPNVMNQSE